MSISYLYEGVLEQDDIQTGGFQRMVQGEQVAKFDHAIK